MVILYILLGLIGLGVVWIIIDILLALRHKPIPDLPKEFLDPTGLSLIYHYLTEPDKVPADLIIDKDYIFKCIMPSVEYINGRYDCADFRLQLLFRLYKDCNDKLPLSVKAVIKKTCIDFKYWMDEPGEDSMCFWSENHQLLFAVSEFLSGQEWPKDMFTNSRMTGAEHMEKALRRINIWMEQRYRFGFSEWYSNNYYAENIAPMSNYIQYSRHKDSIDRMKIIFDLLWFDIATHCVNNTLVSVSSRMYGDNKSSDIYGNRIRAAMEAIWKGIDTSKLVNARSSIEQQIISGGMDVETTVKLVGVDAQMMQNFIAMYKAGYYKLPDVIYDIALDTEPTIIKASSGIGVSDLVGDNLIGQDDYQIMAQMGAETFTNAPVIDNTIKYLSRVKMFRNKFVNPFRFINIKLLRLLGIPKLISRKFKLMTNGIALERGNVYCYRTKDYTLTTAMAQNVDECGAQAHIWSANIAPDLAVYTTHPARDDNSRDKHGASPGYWVGNGRQPMSVQDENVNITIYRMPARKRLLEFHIANITHAYMPREKFDIIEITNNYVFGKRGNVLISMIANGNLKYRPYDSYASSLLKQHDRLVEKLEEIQVEEEFDLVREGGGYHTYITELSDTDKESYEDFKGRILNNKVEVMDGYVRYKTDNREFYVGYDKTYSINGQNIDINYKRYDSKYAIGERSDPTITYQYNKKKLILDYNKKERKTK